MFTLPTFNLVANLWHRYTAGVNTYAAPDLTPSCNLSPGKRVMLPFNQVSGIPYSKFPMELLLPAGTDIRPEQNLGVTTADVVEVPQGSKRFYYVNYVDDIGKGFANEHRFAIINMFFDVITFSDVSFNQPDVPIN